MENNDFWDFENDTVQEDMTLKTVYKAPYGTLYYVTGPSSTEVKSVDLLENDIPKLYSPNTSGNRAFSVGSPAVTIKIPGNNTPSANDNIICGVDVPPVQSIGNGFLAGIQSLLYLYIPDSVQSIGNDFCYIYNTNNAFALGFQLSGKIMAKGVQTIGNNFLYNHRLNNCSGVDMPELISVGDGFMLMNNYSVDAGLDGTLNLPKLRTAGNNFMGGRTQFNNDISLPSLEQLGNRFLLPTADMNREHLFNGELDFPKLETVGDYFISGNSSYRPFGHYTKTPNCPKLKTAGNYFFSCIGSLSGYTRSFDFSNAFPKLETVGSSAFYLSGGANSSSNPAVLTLPPNLKEVGINFCYQAFFGTINGTSSLKKIGQNFCQNCNKLNSPIDVSNVSRGIPTDFSSFLSGCTILNSQVTLPTDLSGFDEGAVGRKHPESFMSSCKAFNSAIVNLDLSFYVGPNFLSDCNAFNQPLDFSTVTDFPVRSFMWRCSAYSYTIDLSNAVNVDASGSGDIILYDFGFEWRKLQSLALPATMHSRIKKIGGSGFLTQVGNQNNNALINPSMTWLNQITTIGDGGQYAGSLNSFISLVRGFNQPLDFSNVTNMTLRPLYFSFISHLDSFNQPISFPSLTHFLFGDANSSISNPGFMISDNAVFNSQVSSNNHIFEDTVLTGTPYASNNGYIEFLCNNPVYSYGVDVSRITTLGVRIYCRNTPAPASLDLSSVTTIEYHAGIGFDNPHFNAAITFNQNCVIKSVNSTAYKFLIADASSFNQPLTLPSGLTSIGAYFLSKGGSSGYMVFNQPLIIPASVTSIGNTFLANTYNTAGSQKNEFNSALTFEQGSAITTIGQSFLAGTKFNQPLELPQTLTSIGTAFLFDAINMVSPVDVGSLAETVAAAGNNTFATPRNTADSYTQGIPIKGANRAAWIARFPDRTSSPYRKLLDYGS